MASLTYDEGPFGLSWILGESLTRTSHALTGDDGRVWLVDPVDEPEAMARAAALGEPAAVVQLLDRHNRDCAAVAARLGVAHVRAWKQDVGAPFETIGVVDWPKWKEAALWWPERSTLVVAETVGTNPVWAAGPCEAGVHPMLRMIAPGALRGRTPEHLLVGHGPGVHGPGTAATLEEALSRSRRDIPRALIKLPKLRP